MDNLTDHAAQHEPSQPLDSMGSDDDKVSVTLIDVVDEFMRRVTFQDYRFHHVSKFFQDFLGIGQQYNGPVFASSTPLSSSMTMASLSIL